MEPATYKEIKSLFDEYIDLYSSRNDLLTNHFSSDFSGFAGGADDLVKNREEWIAVTRQDFAQVKGAIRIQVKDLAIQSLAEDIAVATSFFSIKLPIEDDYFSRKTARLVLIFHKQAGEWKIAHSSISIPYGLVGKGEIYPLKGVEERNRSLERIISERTKELADANQALRESETRLKEAQAIAHIGSWAWNIASDHVECSDEMFHLVGLEKDTFAVSPEAVLAQVIHPDDRQRVDDARLMLVNDKKALPIDFRVIWPDQSVHVVCGEGGKLLLDDAGNPSVLLGTVQDITARKRALETLQESERRFREMLETINLLAITLDTNGKVTFCNNYLLTLTDWRREDVIDVDWFEKFIPEENSDLRSLYLDSLAASALPAHQENPIRTRSGEIRLIHWNNTILRDGTGRIVGTASIGEDVTERKQIEERAARLAAIVQSSEDAIIGTTLEGMVTSWNTGAEKIFGYAEAEVLGKSIAMLVPPGRGDEVPKILQRIRRGDHIEHYDTLRLRKDATDVFMALSISPIFNIEGKVVAVSTIGRDVTERKRGEEVLRRSEEQFRLIAENVADMIAVFDLDGRRLYSSPAYRSILRDQELLNGANGFQSVHPDDAVRVNQAFRETVGTGIAQRIEFRLLAKDGSTRNIDSKASVIKEIDGTFSRAIVVSRDVTEERMLAAQFLRSQRMESIGTLAGGIAHDLNNILAPIMMAIELLRNQVPDPRGQKLLTTIETSAMRGADIVKQVLAFGRGVTGDRVLVQLKHVITDVVKIVGATFPKSITIEAATRKDLWAVQADPTQMHQVLLNLLVNARDAMPGGGILTISAENIRLDDNQARMHREAKPGNYICIVLSDTGTGIPEDIREKIFEPFFTTKEMGKGTGLGLSTTQAIVKSHGGFIGLESEVGKGSTFRIYIPATGTASAVAMENRVADLPEGNGELILIIDDEAAIREIARETLEAYGYKAMTAMNGSEGVAAYVVHREKIKVVITDSAMPGMDGKAVARALKEINPDVKIIASSGLITEERIDTRSGAEVETFLKKPYTAEKLLKALAAVLSAPRGKSRE